MSRDWLAAPVMLKSFRSRKSGLGFWPALHHQLILGKFLRLDSSKIKKTAQEEERPAGYPISSKDGENGMARPEAPCLTWRDPSPEQSGPRPCGLGRKAAAVFAHSLTPDGGVLAHTVSGVACRHTAWHRLAPSTTLPEYLQRTESAPRTRSFLTPVRTRPPLNGSQRPPPAPGLS